MPFWGCALLSGALFIVGLVGFLWPDLRDKRTLSALLMINGALLLVVAAANDLASADGQAVAVVLLGILALECMLHGVLRDASGTGKNDGA